MSNALSLGVLHPHPLGIVTRLRLLYQIDVSGEGGMWAGTTNKSVQLLGWGLPVYNTPKL